MDKFGIFKLLNSFLSPSANNKTDGEKENSANGDILKSLISSLSSNNSDKKDTAPVAPKPPTKPTVPLQSGMLYTMNSHDEFIKRVKQKHLQK